MKLLITRPAADAAPLAELLKAAGHSVLIDSMLDIRRREGIRLDLAGVQGLLFTSANGVRAFAAASVRRDVVVYAVGDRTAEAAAAAGFAKIESADGDVAALVALVQAKVDKAAGALLHVSGTEVAGDIAGTLTAAGYDIRSAALYEAQLVDALSAETRQAISDGTLDGVLLFSPRTARHFSALLRLSGLAPAAGRLTAWCLSNAVAEALSDLTFVAVTSAPEPTQASLLATIGPATTPALAEPGSVTKPATEPKPLPAPVVTLPLPPPPPAPPKPEVTARAKTKARKWPWLIGLILLAGGAYLGRPYWQPAADKLFPVADKLLRAGEKALDPPAAHPNAPAPTPAQQVARPVPEPSPVAPSPVPIPEPSPAPVSAAAAVPPPPVIEPEPAAHVDAPPAITDSRIEAVQSDLAALARRLDALAAQPSVDPQQVQHLADDLHRMDAAQTQIAQRLDKVAAQVDQRVAEVRNERTLVLAAGQIRDAIANSGPFEAPIAVIRAVAPDDAALVEPLAKLDRAAKTGVPSRVVLAEDLTALGPALTAAPAPAANAGLWQSIGARVENLITLRRIDDGSGPDSLPPGPERALANAQRALRGGDLAAAIQAIEGLEGNALAAAKPWLDRATARLDSEQAADALVAELTRRLSTGIGTGTAP